MKKIFTPTITWRGIERIQRHPAGFIALFLTFLVLGQMMHKTAAPYLNGSFFEISYALPVVYLINTLAPEDEVRFEGNILISRNHGETYTLTDSCDTFSIYILLFAAIMAFPLSPKKRLKGLLWGGGFTHSVNLTRLVILYFLRIHHPNLFDFSHVYILRSAAILSVLAFFIYWVEHGNTASKRIEGTDNAA